MAGYSLGVDLGTTFTAAATAADGRVEMLALTTHGLVVPTVVYLGPDDQWLVGSSAERRSLTDPTRVAREFKRRFGDPTPLVLGGVPVAPERLMGQVLSWSYGYARDQEGTAPEAVAITHPANWGPFKLDLLRDTALAADVPGAVLVPEPVAAAWFYAAGRDIPEGEVLAVYDLGGGTFDATLLERTAAGFEIVGEPQGIERLGGIDFDSAILNHVRQSLDGDTVAFDEEAKADLAVIARLREECRTAKEALSGDAETEIPLILPGLQTSVRLTRSEFEDMIRVPVQETVSVLERTVREAGLRTDEIGRVLLVGGCSRIPLVGESVADALGRPVVVDAHPKNSVALGAAAAAARGGTAGLGAAPVAAAAAGTGATAGEQADDELPPDQPEETPTGDEQSPAASGGAPRRLIVALAVVGAVILLAGGALALMRGDDDGGGGGGGGGDACCIAEVPGLPSGAAPTALGLQGDLVNAFIRSRDAGLVWSADPATPVSVAERDVASQSLSDTISVPTDVGREVWVSDFAGDRVVALSADGLGEVATIDVGAGPQALAASSDGTVWVANSGDGTVSAMDPDSHSVVATVEVGAAPVDLAVDGDDPVVWVANHEDDSVSVVSIESRSVVGEVTVGDGPVAIRKLEGKLWVANSLDSTVSVFEPEDATSGGRVDARRIPVGGTPVSIAPQAIGGGSLSGRIWVPLYDTGEIAMLEPESESVVASLPVADGPVFVTRSVLGDAELAWVSSFDAGTVTRVDVAALAGILAADPGADLSSIAQGLPTVDVGGEPREILAFDETVVVERWSGDAVVVIDAATLGATLLVPPSQGPATFLSPGAAQPPSGASGGSGGTGVTGGTGDTTTPTTSPPTEIVTVPPVDGLSVPEASATLQAAGLSAVIQQQESPDVPVGTVITSSPAAGTDVEVGTTVILIVSA